MSPVPPVVSLITWSPRALIASMGTADWDTLIPPTRSITASMFRCSSMRENRLSSSGSIIDM